MIRYVRKPFTDEMNLSVLDEDIRKWFISRFSKLTPPQQYSYRLIAQGKNVLITAPTGSGKTFSAFMVILSELMKLEKQNKLEDGVYCIYISPLKALDNDIRKNLIQPLTEIEKDMNKKINIRIAIRTGDVTPYEKQKQLKKPPHILITTPESFAIILNSSKFVEKLMTVRYVVIDEIHELASSKRGVHLSLSVERLCEMLGKKIVRIGLGATLHPLDVSAKFLVGYTDGKPRDCCIVDVSWFKKFNLKLVSPTSDIVHTDADTMNELLYDILDKIIRKNKTTLVFTNTRSGTERVVYHLKEKRFSDDIAAHHGSLSRDIRWDVEDKLKKGDLKCVVCSTSLELGIDIGYINTVVQIGSPKSVTRAVQRIGRSGHGLMDTAKGIIIGMDRDDLIECGVMLFCIQKKKLDKIQIPTNCLDVLAQHIVGMALTRKWNVKDMYRVVKRSYCYHDMDYDTFLSVLRYLSGKYAKLEDRNVYGKIWFDEDTGEIGRRGRYTRVIYYLNIGTIPDEVAIDVYDAHTRRYIGNIQEDFLERLRKGDIFVLGGKTYEFRYARGIRCYVIEKIDIPTIPSWFSELLPLSYDLAIEIGKFRRKIFTMFNKKLNKNRIIKFINTLPVDKNAAESIYEYFRLQYLYVHIFPTDKTVIIEKTKGLKGRTTYVYHFLFGRRTNDALSRIFGFVIGKILHTDVRLTISDNGFAIEIDTETDIPFDTMWKEIYNTDVRILLRNNIRKTEMMKRKFRHCASRSFLVLRNYKGHKIRVGRQQVNAETILKVCENIEMKFPIVEETYREILEDVMDIEHAKIVISMLKSGKINVKYIETPTPSPFAQGLILLGEPDIIRMKSRKERLMELHERILKQIELRKRMKK